MSGINRLAEISLIYLDANIFIHAFEPSPQFDRLISNELIMFMSRYGKANEPVFCTSQFTFGELWVGPYKKNKQDLIQLYENLSFSNKFLKVAPLDLEVLRGAAILRGKHTALRMPDALHVSTSILFGCKYFMTSDERIKGSYDFTSNRSGFQRRFFETTVVRPNLATLARLTTELSVNE